MDDQFATSVLSGKIMVAIHEVRAPADERYQHRDRIKSLLTDTFLTVNEKHLPRWQELFCSRLLMFTNKDDALPLSETDRRVYAVRCNDVPKGSDYYTHLYKLVRDRRFLAALWHRLRARDITHFNPGARAPLNEMKQQMIAAGRTEEQQQAATFVRSCPFPVVDAAALMALLVPPLYEESDRDRRSRITAVVAVMRDIGAQAHVRKVKVDRIVTRVWMLRDTAKWSQAMPAALATAALEAREFFSAPERNWSIVKILEAWE
jgi:hypothetical protein